MKKPMFDKYESFSKLLRSLCKNTSENPLLTEEQAVSTELFSTGQMKQHGKNLAEKHQLETGNRQRRLLDRLSGNEELLISIHHLLTVHIPVRKRVPAVDWFLDNFYLIEENIQTTKRHFPQNYNFQLPHLAAGNSVGFPRVYALAYESITHGDGRFDLENLNAFIKAYQSVTPLLLGELWAIPIMLRLALIENIRRVAATLGANQIARDMADDWANRMINDISLNPSNLILTIADMARSEPPMTSSFVATFTSRLQGQDSALTLSFTWLEQWLSEFGLTIDQLVSEDLQQQAADQVSMSNSIDALRCLDTTDWHKFVEDTSAVESVLRQDPTGIYPAMDFATRDRYRHIIEKLASHTPVYSEKEIAEKAMRMAMAAAKNGATEPMRHVGYYLVDRGLSDMKVQLGMRISPTDRIRNVCRRFAFPLYVMSVLGVMIVSALYFAVLAGGSGLNGWGLWCIGLLALLGTSNLAVALVNCPAMLLVTPERLPRMDFSKGIPESFCSMVVVPTILNDKAGIEKLIRSLEVAFLANRDDNLHFGLLTDFCDAPTEKLAEDQTLLGFARTEIEKFNRKYPNPHYDSFFLFHRPRLWNPQEGVWMGYERKRGKLADLNRLLRGKSNGSFELVTGSAPMLARIKYVITLDSDTQLPRESARQFIETMAHPLNHARYDEKKQRVIGGYGVLQPRVTMSLSGMNRSLYARMYTNEWGIDPYTRSVSDVYQDLFSEGSFIGKGIYDVDVFDKVLGSRFPDNRILSHDLLEGCYIRSGLLSDVPLYEEYPSSYHDDVGRRRRWIRGDWQVAHWIMPRVLEADGQLHPNPLSLLSRWKLLDNLLRSLAPPSLFLLLFFGWSMLSFPGGWTWEVAAIILLPSFMSTLLNLFQKSNEITLRQHFGNVREATFRRFFLAAFSFACLPYEAFYTLDSIVRAIWRLSFSHRKLLEWKSSDSKSVQPRNGLAATFRIMWIIPYVVGISALLFTLLRPELLPTALPVLILWLAAPIIVWKLGRPIIRQKKRLSSKEIAFLRRISRKTWAFFAEFVGPEDHYLPPDNVQAYPVETIAHRTSPTNIGLALLANLAAHDFGTILTGQLLKRTANTFGTLEKLDRCKGHFYNWYDTKTLNPLNPLYVSSVDSGNLAGHLHVLRMGLLELPEREIISLRSFESLADTIEILAEAMDAATENWDRGKVISMKEAVSFSNTESELTLSMAWNRLESLAELLIDMGRDRRKNSAELGEAPEYWLRTLSTQCTDLRNELKYLTPWVKFHFCRVILDDFPMLDRIPKLRELSGLKNFLCGQPDLPPGLNHFVSVASARAAEWLDNINRLTTQCGQFNQMDYRFLYDESRHLLSIGYNAEEARLDANYYDLLASESRLATFTAIAQGQLPQKSWFALSRLLTIMEGKPILLSWSGSMFEYLMPLLVMPCYEHTLISDTCKAAVEIQIAYGKKRRVPWGISECGYNAVDTLKNYQYKAFGVPGLGLKRNLADDLVIAPYASMLALTVAPKEACVNLEKLTNAGFEGKYGYYEAVDYTPSHLPHGQYRAVIKSFMVHHQGMGLLALDGILSNQPMQKRFCADPAFQATLLLLQERVPKATAFYAFTTEIPEHQSGSDAQTVPLRIFRKPDTATPAVHLLSNGKYHVMITNAGGGYSRWNGLALTRWNEDAVRDADGVFCYIRDMASGKVWSGTHQPVCTAADSFETIFSDGRAEFKRSDNKYDTHIEIAVSPEDDVELRRIRITNREQFTRTIDVTSYAEIVLAPPAADTAHPAFSNLFVETEIIRARRAILCSRRPRGKDEHIPWLFHLMASHGGESGDTSYETDRLSFIGRGNTPANPRAATGNTVDGYADVLSGHEGPVLDPIAAIRSRITLAAGETVTINLVTGVADNREDALHLTEKYREKHLSDRVFELAWTHEQVLLSQLNASEADAQLFMRLAGSILYANSALRTSPEVIARNKRGQSGLWGYTISGDLPIVLLKIGNPANIELARQLVQAHAYWHLKGLAVDLVIWNEDVAGYRQILHDQIAGLIASGTENNVTDRPGGIFLRDAPLISEEDRALIQSCARVILSDRRGTLEEQIGGQTISKVNIPLLQPSFPAFEAPSSTPLFNPKGLLYENGLGGFSPDGREYVIAAGPDRATPAPWVNILANPSFGSMISESGQSCTWCENAHEFRLTPWENDPVCDTGGEAIYLRDEENGRFWSPMPFPCAGKHSFIVRHGFGYSTFESNSFGIHSETTVYVAAEAAVKFTVLKIKNESNCARKLSVTGYVELVLGDQRAKNMMHVITEVDQTTGALFARNRYNTEFHRQTVFFDADSPNRSLTCDRLEFLGRHGELRSPAAMRRTKLSGKIGAALDPCFAIHVNIDLESGEEREIIFRLGCGHDVDDARSLVRCFRQPDAPRKALDAVRSRWEDILGKVKVETPNTALNLLTNGWLLYQTIGCRLWARCAKYQSGGAFGFRDQLQDVLALVHSAPELVREHLLVAAAHQFQEGDVMHWWHPPLDRGVRTHCSDDYLWLPFAVCRYVGATGDTGILDENVPFLKGRPVKPEEDSYYDLPSRSEESATLYEHCVRSIRHGLKFGIHGLPLIGSGDWNDGMNLVGEHGKGESVWLGFFLYDVLTSFAPLADNCEDFPFARHCRKDAEKLRRNIESSGWDGEWYRRAYFDDGSPLGSSANSECKIDSIAQSWSVLSGGGNPEKSRMAMNAVWQSLADRNHQLVRLLTPPFDKSALEPGYIKGYVPGVRENGGQYTHAAVWAAMAFAKAGDAARAWELFEMINPVHHASDSQKCSIYKVEPYVVAADVYAVSPHTGRGGWTWYSGAAGWMYQLILETLLGVTLDVDKLRISPCFPKEWNEFTVHYRYRKTWYHIHVHPSDIAFITVDDIKQTLPIIPLVNNGKPHYAEVGLTPPGAI